MREVDLLGDKVPPCWGTCVPPCLGHYVSSRTNLLGNVDGKNLEFGVSGPCPWKCVHLSPPKSAVGRCLTSFE